MLNAAFWKLGTDQVRFGWDSYIKHENLVFHNCEFNQQLIGECAEPTGQTKNRSPRKQHHRSYGRVIYQASLSDLGGGRALAVLSFHQASDESNFNKTFSFGQCRRAASGYFCRLECLWRSNRHASMGPDRMWLHSWAMGLFLRQDPRPHAERNCQRRLHRIQQPQSKMPRPRLCPSPVENRAIWTGPTIQVACRSRL